MRKNTIDDLWTKLDRSGGPDACWPYLGSKSVDGYGEFWMNGERHRAHRLALSTVIGPLPAHLFTCHRCDNPSCCNPAHLFLGTAADNYADMKAKARGKAETHGARHGTYSGYVRHVRQRDGEWAMPACDPCRAANAAYRRKAVRSRRETLDRNATHALSAFVAGMS